MTEEKIKYSDIVSEVVDKDKYFTDAMDWYIIKYYNIIVERTFFILLSIFSFLIILFLYITLTNILPLKEQFPVLIRQKDSIKYISKISPVKPLNIDYTSSEAVLRLLLLKFTREIFTHDYSRGDLDDLNNKLSRISSIASEELFLYFKNEFNKLAGTMFNKNIKQKVVIKSFSLVDNDEDKIKNTSDMVNNLKNYFTTKIPTEAMLDCDIIIYVNGEIHSEENKKVKLIFKYTPVVYNVLKNDFSKPNLIISNYEIINQNLDIKNNKNNNVKQDGEKVNE